MSFEIVEKSQVNREITLTVPGSEVRSVESLMVENARRKMVVNGFRKGKVPASVVRERAGAAIMEDVPHRVLDIFSTRHTSQLGHDPWMRVLPASSSGAARQSLARNRPVVQP